MTNEPNTFDVNFVFDLAQRPTLEEELHMEKEIRAIRESNDIEELKKYAEMLSRQNHEQSYFIAGCLTKIGTLHAKIASLKINIERPSKTLLEKILRL